MLRARDPATTVQHDVDPIKDVGVTMMLLGHLLLLTRYCC